LFEKHREKKAAEHYQHELEQWQEQVNSTAELLHLAQTYNGDTAAQIILKPGEAVFATVTGVGLIEERSGGGQWQGRSRGVSVPVGSIGGHAVRYHVGATKGHYVPAEPVATAIDTGTAYLTSQRVIFQGARQTRECLYTKLIGYEHTSDGSTVFSVSNRQKPTVIHYGPKIAGWFDFRLELALAHNRGTLDRLIAQLQAQQQAATDRSRARPAEQTGR
jgi:hypothetical protein